MILVIAHHAQHAQPLCTLQLIAWYLDHTDETVPLTLLRMLNQIFLGDSKCQKFFCSSSHGLLGTSPSASQYNGQWFKLPSGGASRFWISTANSFASFGGYTAICKRLLRTDVPPVPLAEVDLYLTSVLQKAEYTCTESFRDTELKDLLQALFVRCIHSLETDSISTMDSPPIRTVTRMVAAADSVLKACEKRYGLWAKNKRRLFMQWRLMLLLAMLQHGSLPVVESALRDIRAVCSATGTDAALMQFCLQWLDSQNIIMRMLNALDRLSIDGGGPPSLSGGVESAVETGSTDDSEEDEEDDDVPPTEAPSTPNAQELSLADTAALCGTSAAALLHGGQLAVGLLPSDVTWLKEALLSAATELQLPSSACLEHLDTLSSTLNGREVAALQATPSLVPCCLKGLQAMPASQKLRLLHVPLDDVPSGMESSVGAVSDTLADLTQGGLLRVQHLQHLASAHRTCSSNSMHQILGNLRAELEVELLSKLNRDRALALLVTVRLGGNIQAGSPVVGKLLEGEPATSACAAGADVSVLHSALDDIAAQMTRINGQIAGLMLSSSGGPGGAAAAAPAQSVGGAAAGSPTLLQTVSSSTSATAQPSAADPPAPPPAAQAGCTDPPSALWLAAAVQELGLDARQAGSLRDFAAFLVQQGGHGGNEAAN